MKGGAALIGSMLSTRIAKESSPTPGEQRHAARVAPPARRRPSRADVPDETPSVSFDAKGGRVTAESRRADVSPARILEAADEARRQIERDLHDGAQPRLVLALISLRRAHAQAHGTPVQSLIAEALAQLQLGLAELRDLARGIRPAVLGDRGLAAALGSLAPRLPVPVELRVTPERFPPTVEDTIYFTVAEALTNVAKHARATVARVKVGIDNGRLVAEVTDDGLGGARIAAGSGLEGLADRLDALDGTLTVRSPPSGGTMLRASIPLRTDTVPSEDRRPNDDPQSTRARLETGGLPRARED
jgi:signal transduction histidine kinase